MSALEFSVDATPTDNTAAGGWQKLESFPLRVRLGSRPKAIDSLAAAVLLAHGNLGLSLHPKTEVRNFTEQELPFEAAQRSNSVCKFDARLSLIDILQSLEKPQALELTKLVSDLSARRLSDDPAAQDCFYKARGDAVRFVALLPDNVDRPNMSISDDGEIVFDWLWNGKQALVDFDGDGSFGYALLKNGRFEPGAQPGELANDQLPADLMDYIQRA